MNKKIKRYLPMIISFAVVVISAVLLVALLSVFQSKTTNRIYQFDEAIEYKNGILVGENKAFRYNQYGGSISESEALSIPLSQYGGPDYDYLFYTFDSKYFGVNDGIFNGGNTSDLFLSKVNDTLYLTDTYQKKCTPISEQTDFHSLSTQGNYLLEVKDNECYFYKRLNADYKLSDPIKMDLTYDNIEICFWINDSYILLKSDDTYFIANAQNGETAPCATVKDDFVQKELISKRYFFTSFDKEQISIFDIYTQEEILFPYKSDDSVEILSISDNGEYALIKNETFAIISAKGKSIDVASFIEGSFVKAEFIADNIILITESINNKDISSIHKIML